MALIRRFKKVISPVKTKEPIAREILNSFSISELIRNIFIEDVYSPWNEKVVRLPGQHGQIDVKLSLWNSDRFLYGRIYRLFLYVCDDLDDHFQYDPKLIPHGTSEPKTRETYNQIWGIYVDSRIEKLGIENFFDKTLRRNLFIDSQKNLPWTVSNLFFEKLWNKPTYTHAEMIEHAYHLDLLSEGEGDKSDDAFEMEISRSLMDHSAKKNIDNIVSIRLRDIAHTILYFVASHCRGTLIESSYYGIYFMYDQEIFAEMATTKTDSLLLTLFDFQSNTNKTYTMTENAGEINTIQQEIKTIYDSIANHSRLKVIKNPYAEHVEK
jgi:hypothetical protein